MARSSWNLTSLRMKIGCLSYCWDKSVCDFVVVLGRAKNKGEKQKLISVGIFVLTRSIKRMNTHCKVWTACREDDFVCLQELSFSSQCAIDKSAIFKKCIKDRDECTLMIVPSETELLIVIHGWWMVLWALLLFNPFYSSLLELSEKMCSIDLSPFLLFLKVDKTRGNWIPFLLFWRVLQFPMTSL